MIFEENWRCFDVDSFVCPVFLLTGGVIIDHGVSQLISTRGGTKTESLPSKPELGAGDAVPIVGEGVGPGASVVAAAASCQTGGYWGVAFGSNREAMWQALRILKWHKTADMASASSMTAAPTTRHQGGGGGSRHRRIPIDISILNKDTEDTHT